VVEILGAKVLLFFDICKYFCQKVVVTGKKPPTSFSEVGGFHDPEG